MLKHQYSILEDHHQRASALCAQADRYRLAKSSRSERTPRGLGNSILYRIGEALSAAGESLKSRNSWSPAKTETA